MSQIRMELISHALHDVFHIIDAVRIYQSCALCSPVTEYSTHSAMFTT